jgi:hypothetical protein
MLLPCGSGKGAFIEGPQEHGLQCHMLCVSPSQRRRLVKIVRMLYLVGQLVELVLLALPIFVCRRAVSRQSSHLLSYVAEFLECGLMFVGYRQIGSGRDRRGHY